MYISIRGKWGKQSVKISQRLFEESRLFSYKFLLLTAYFLWLIYSNSICPNYIEWMLRGSSCHRTCVFPMFLLQMGRQMTQHPPLFRSVYLIVWGHCQKKCHDIPWIGSATRGHTPHTPPPQKKNQNKTNQTNKTLFLKEPKKTVSPRHDKVWCTHDFTETVTAQLKSQGSQRWEGEVAWIFTCNQEAVCH